MAAGSLPYDRIKPKQAIVAVRTSRVSLLFASGKQRTQWFRSNEWTQIFPGFQTTKCTAPANTTAAGLFTDAWSLSNDDYIAPAGAATCGVGVTDKWYWAGTASLQQELGILFGVVNTTQITINGTLQMAVGTVINH